MQFKRFSIPLTAMTLALATTFSLPRPSLPERQPRFFCGIAHGFPTTLYSTEVQNVELIYWKNKIGSLLPEQRCQEVSRRFDRFHKIGQLKYLTTGEVNDLPVICATQYRDDLCSTSTVLLTLRLEDNPNKILNDLLNGSVIARGKSYGHSLMLGLENERIEMLERKDGFVSVDIQFLIDSLSQVPAVTPQD